MKNTLILVTKPTLGSTGPNDVAFGTEMLDKFFHTLEQQRIQPLAICFYTEGVKLVVANSPIEVSLKLLRGMGVRIVICSTCLAYYGLADDVAVGEVSRMTDIVGLMAAADKVITI